MEFTVEESGQRLDQFLTLSFTDDEGRQMYSRSMIQRLIKEGNIRIFRDDAEVAAKKIKASFLLDEGYTVSVANLDILRSDGAAEKLTPTHIDFTVLFEDEYLAVIVKPAGVTVHPTPGSAKNNEPTLLHGILHRWPTIGPAIKATIAQSKDDTTATENADSSALVSQRPGIVHRLDRPTEGLMMIAKTAQMQWQLSRLFQKREVEKEYLAWLTSPPPEEHGTINQPLMRHPVDRIRMMVHKDGRAALTEYSIENYVVSRKGRKFTQVRVNLLTGRTHQIRAHFAHLHCPVVGDDLYSASAKEFSRFGLLLLSRRLGFVHPVTGKKMSFEAEIPKRFIDFQEQCSNY